jgi:hypothetical protein
MVARYLKLLLTYLVYGVIGPIFLAVYFSLSSDERARADGQWMLWCGLAVTVFDVIWPFRVMYSQSKSAAKTELLEQQGVLALAEVVGLTETKVTINERPVVKLDLHITGPNLTPFNAQERVQVSLIRRPMITGRKLVVLVDPTDNTYQIDWQRSAFISGVAPFRVRSEADNRTYDLTGQVGPLMDILQVFKSNRLPYTGPIDLRANPDVREQVYAIARRAGAAQQAPAAPQFPPAPHPPSVRAPRAAQRMPGTDSAADGASSRLPWWPWPLGAGSASRSPCVA